MLLDFDPMRDVRFRGKALSELTHRETLDALVQALAQVRYLEMTRPPGVWPSTVPLEGPLRPIPVPPRSDFL